MKIQVLFNAELGGVEHGNKVLQESVHRCVLIMKIDLILLLDSTMSLKIIQIQSKRDSPGQRWL